MSQVKISFAKMDKAGLRPLMNQFEIQGMKVSDVNAPNKPKRESGILVKNATFIFESGQKLLLRVKSDGTVFQVKLNNKVLPIRNVDDMSKAIDEIIGHVKANETKFIKAKQKRLARKKLPLDKKPKVRVTRRQNLEQAESRVSELTAESDDLQQKIETGQELIDTKSGQAEELSEKLKSLQERGKELETEIKSLEAT